MEQNTYIQTFQAIGVHPQLAQQAGEIALRQAQDPSYNLSNADRNILTAAYQQVFQQQLQQALEKQKEDTIQAHVKEYVLLLDQAQETESISLIDAASQIKHQLLSEGLLTETEFEKRVSAEDEALWVANPDQDDTDDAAFEARWRQETAGLGIPGNSLMQDHNPDDAMRSIREEQSRQEKVRNQTQNDKIKSRSIDIDL